jgi:hypothetical protein
VELAAKRGCWLGRLSGGDLVCNADFLGLVDYALNGAAGHEDAAGGLEDSVGGVVDCDLRVAMAEIGVG